MICRMIIIALLIPILSLPAVAQKQKQKKKKRLAVKQNVFKAYEAHSFEGVPYRLMKPIDLEDNADKSYPLILSLHGAGGKGNGNKKNLRNWNGYIASEKLRHAYPCFVVAPQSLGAWRMQGDESHFSEKQIEELSPVWKEIYERRFAKGGEPTAGVLGKVFKLLDSLSEEFNIDPDRVYVLGHSMGGFGTWTALGEQPKRFAAAIPTAGGLKPIYDVKTFAHVPIWAFHGTADTTVSPALTLEAFTRLKAVDANIKYTVLRRVGHGPTVLVFNTREMIRPKAM